MPCPSWAMSMQGGSGISPTIANKAAGSRTTLLDGMTTPWGQHFWCLLLLCVSPGFWWGSQLCAPHEQFAARSWSWQCRHYWCVQSLSGQQSERRHSTEPGLLQRNRSGNPSKGGWYGFYDGKDTGMPTVPLMASKLTRSTCAFSPTQQSKCTQTYPVVEKTYT